MNGLRQWMKVVLFSAAMAVGTGACDDDNDNDAGGCSVTETEDGAVVTCGDDSVTVHNGEKGDPGNDGENGDDGDDGENGENGEPGPQGDPGQDGMDGDAGVDGVCANNSAPTISEVTADTADLCDSGMMVVTVDASDDDGDALTYHLAVSGVEMAADADNPGVFTLSGVDPTAPATMTAWVTDGCEIAIADTSVDALGVCYPKKNVILFIGDGMQLEHEIATSRYLTGTDNGLSFHSFPYRNHVTTWDVNTYNLYAAQAGEAPYNPNDFDPILGYDPEQGGDAPYPEGDVPDESYFLGYIGTSFTKSAVPATDSASAATAMSCGKKTEAGNIAWEAGDPEDGSLETIGEWMKGEMGASYGVVSSVQFAHATPAAFASHNDYRSNYEEISDEIIFSTQPDVVIGAGHPYWSGSFRYVTESGYDYVQDSERYVLAEREAGADGGLALEVATAQVVANIASGSLQTKLIGIYGGADDYMEHPVPADGGVDFTEETENPSLAESTGAALSVLSQNEDGFFVMVEGGDIDWANHANDYAWMIGAMKQFNDAVIEAVDFVDAAGDDITWDNTLLIVTSDHSNSYMRLNDNAVLGMGELPEQVEADGAWTYPGGEVTYGSGGHTNELVTLAARGADATLFADRETRYPGLNIVDNTDIYDVMRAAVEEGSTKNVILLIGDGMNIAHEVAASRYLFGTDDDLAWHAHDTDAAAGFNYAGWCTTWDVDTYNRFAAARAAQPYSAGGANPIVGYDPTVGGEAPVFVEPAGDTLVNYYLTSLEGYAYGSSAAQPATDSASAATALASGLKTDSGNIAWRAGDPTVGAIETIAEMVRAERHGKMGVVSTVPFSHATPAAFVSHNVSRNNYHEIADEIIFSVKPDVVIGGGHPAWNSSGYRYLSEGAYQELGRSKEWNFVEREAGEQGGAALMAAAEEAAASGQKLFGLFGGEGSNFEPPVPANDAGNPSFEITEENPTLAEATDAAITVLASGDTGFFLMVEQGDIDWANHANNYPDMIGTTYDLDEAVKRVMALIEDGAHGMTLENTLVIITSDHSNSYMRLDDTAVLGAGEMPEELSDNITYGSGNHTNEPVMIYAVGGGIEEGDSGVFGPYENFWYEDSPRIDNTQIFEAMADFLAL